MARITVEDCVEIVPNYFELVLYAARRAREIAAGLPITVSKDNDKNPVIALREIAEKTISTNHLEEKIIRLMQRVGLRDEADEDLENEFLKSAPPLDMNEDDDDVAESQIQQLEAESILSPLEDESQ